ncbi:kinase-like protein [Sanghuangporus baumii]|uniref:Kinase-like protein n=1 Tax=Sanghuangporus baumii TaxID=108892 RepID=A0A9Q5NFD1_SANBA|nr:kinase-like protein [Sanghuangporus baumii]
MQRLARRVVIQVLEKVQLIAIKEECPIAERLKVIAERCRDVLLYHIVLCYNLPSKDANFLQELFEQTVPVVYVVSKVVQACSTHEFDETSGIVHCQKLDHLLIELLGKCYLLGNEVSFDVNQFIEQLKASSVFDFDVAGSYSSREKDGLVLQKAEDREEDSIGKPTELCPQSESEPSQSASDIGKKLSADAFYYVKKLETRVLEEIGLKQLKHVVYESKKWKGDGKYADVFEMQREKGLGTRLLRESQIWMTVKHARIAPLLGFVCFDSTFTPQLCLVSNSYHTDLKKIVKDYGTNGQNSDSKALNDERKLEFLRDVILALEFLKLRDVILALEFLHASGTAHGDLRAENVLVTNELLDDTSCYAVLNDFGLAEHRYSNISRVDDYLGLASTTRTRGYWIAPELIDEALEHGSLPKASKKGDIYSFGVVFLEVVYERDPYEGLMISVSDAKSTMQSPAKQEDLNLLAESHWPLMQGCWETPDKRLGILKVAWDVLDILDQLIPPTPTNFDELEGPELAYWSKYLKKPIS